VTETKSVNSVQMLRTDTPFNPVLIVAIVVAVVMLLLIVLLAIYFCHYKRRPTIIKELSEKPDSGSTSNVTQTLVTQILKIALPGYKELEPIAFRLLKKLAEGGGGSVYLAEAISPKLALTGKSIISVIASLETNCRYLLKNSF
jgi:cytochrome bd-type quinol oxidase subunit 1